MLSLVACLHLPHFAYLVLCQATDQATKYPSGPIVHWVTQSHVKSVGFRIPREQEHGFFFLKQMFPSLFYIVLSCSDSRCAVRPFFFFFFFFWWQNHLPVLLVAKT
ncbi:hypothetical protein BC939DRAFT_120966 [Gamsiella multidivaricata]|uniref:uncharacterized protein n=1 Tax=Gamsiella multidivaricata TaxID=101098 RepID=UPI00221EE7F2|nr:uncharacterized protein BC939DRAFT_120966 [Gamsiella multidivaricata]KAI7826106.1 hypothetical protein BC939DRAFT_120966 [Gamsiella multidivaricata]